MPDGANPHQPARRSYVSPLRARQAQQTRDGILDALTQLLETQSADEITTSDLAQAAGVAERSVYRHFPDREALVEGLTARLDEALRPVVPDRLEDVMPMAIQLMGILEAHQVEARAEALLNADPRRYVSATREHTRQFSELVGASLPELDEHQQRGVAAIMRLLVSSQAWLRMREEFGLTGDVSGPMVAWVLDAVQHEIRRGNLPPSAGTTPRVRRSSTPSKTTKPGAKTTTRKEPT